MKTRYFPCAARVLLILTVLLLCGAAFAQAQPAKPTKVYVPYKDLRSVFESVKQGIFLPYAEFHRLWPLRPRRTRLWLRLFPAFWRM